MQQILRRGLVIISGLFLLIFTIVGILASFDKYTNSLVVILFQHLNTAILTDFGLKIIILIISIVLFLFCISVIFSILRFNRREKTVSLKSPYGEVKVSLGAIEDFIKNIKDQIKGIKEIRAKVFARPNGIKIYSKVTLWSDQNISEMAKEIQSTIRYYLHDTLGIEDIAEIKVLVEKILLRDLAQKPISDRPIGVDYPDFE